MDTIPLLLKSDSLGLQGKRLSVMIASIKVYLMGKFEDTVNLFEMLEIIRQRKEPILEYNTKNTAANRAFLEFQVKVILAYYYEYVKKDAADEEAIFMYMYQNSNIMKIFRDVYGTYDDKEVLKWTERDIPKIVKELHSLVKVS